MYDPRAWLNAVRGIERQRVSCRRVLHRRPLQASFEVSLGEVRYLDAEADELWLLTATSSTGEQWTAKAEDYYQAACGLAGIMGFEVEDG